MIGWKPENKERTKMKTYLTTAERDEILNKVLKHAEKEATPGYHYSYAFGYISVLLTDEQLKQLERGLN
jgi:hypothetical protein